MDSEDEQDVGNNIGYELSIVGSKKPKEIVSALNRTTSIACLTKLILPHNGIVELPKEIFGLWALTHLNLCNNEISELPKDVGKLAKYDNSNHVFFIFKIIPQYVERSFY